MLKEEINNKLNQFAAKDLNSSIFRAAAVNIILFPVENSLSLIFTRRSDKVATHKKQISFPGGKMDPTDKSLWKTAIRETFEEIGLAEGKFEYIGRLDDHLTISSFRVRPFVSYYQSGYPLSYNIQKSETDYILEVDLNMLLNENNWQIIDFTLNGKSTGIPHFWYHGNLIWGVTGIILFDFLKKIGGLPSFNSLKYLSEEEWIKYEKSKR